MTLHSHANHSAGQTFSIESIESIDFPPPTRTHPHVVGVVFPVKAQMQLIRFCPVHPPVPEVGLPQLPVCGSVL